MKVWVQWYGGVNYAAPRHGEYEEFSSLAIAKDVFESRFSDRHFPCVENDATMLVYLQDPSEDRDPYPDYEYRVGPRGGIVRDRC